MCYDDNARPPVPTGATGQATGEELTITATDGSAFLAYLARPSQPNGKGILIYPDIRGLHQFYKELALRFAELGMTAIAIDFYGRTTQSTSRSEDFEVMPHLRQIKLDNVMTDTRAALTQLEGCESTFLVGFCLGGAFALLSSLEDLGQSGSIGFYATLSRPWGTRGSALEEAGHIRYPFLGLFGGNDEWLPSEQVNEFKTNIDTSSTPHEVVIYANAPHSFFDREATQYASESEDAWQRVLAFIQTYGKK